MISRLGKDDFGQMAIDTWKSSGVTPYVEEDLSSYTGAAYIFIEENVLPDSGDYTISIWVKADSNNIGARTLISQSDTSGSPFYFGSNSGSDLSGKIKMNQDWKSLESSPFYLDNKWHLYTIVNEPILNCKPLLHA